MTITMHRRCSYHALTAPVERVAVKSWLRRHRRRARKPGRRAQHACKARRAGRGWRRTDRRAQAGAPCGDVGLRLPNDKRVASARRLHRSKKVGADKGSQDSQRPRVVSGLRSIRPPHSSTGLQGFPTRLLPLCC